MEWKNYFSRTILNRGKEYFYENNVDDLIIHGLSLEAYVLGSALYRVYVEITKDRKLEMGCSCPYNAKEPCKHLAAALFEADSQGFFDDERIDGLLGEDDKSVIKQPFAAEKYDECIFNFAEITKKVCCTKADYEKAKKLLQQKKVELISCNTEISNLYSPDFKKIATTYLSGYACLSDSQYPLKVIISEDDILAAESSVPRAQYSYYARWKSEAKKLKLNAYLMAFLFLIDDYIKKHNPGDYTSQGVMTMLQSYANRQASLIPIESSLPACSSGIKLEPRLEISAHGLSASFKIGREKLFVVKNLPALVYEYNNQQGHVLGTKDKLAFNSEKFSEEAEKYFQLLKDVVEDDNFRNKENLKYRSYGEEIKRMASGSSMLLFGRSLDSFYELVNGKKIEAIDKTGEVNKKFTITTREHDGDFSLVIAPEMSRKGVFKGVSITGKLPVFYQGSAFAYYVDDEYLNRTDLKAYMKIKPLVQDSVDGNINLKIGRSNLNQFYHHVLPELGKIVQIVESDADVIEKYLTPEAKFSFFLDYQNEKISCLAKAHYGEQEYNLLKLLAGNTLAANRDEAKEKQLVELLYYYFTDVDISEEAFIIDRDEDAMWTFLEKGVSQLMELGEVSSTAAFKRLKIRNKINVSVGVALDSGLMDLSITSTDFSLEELLGIIDSYKKKKKYHRLRNGDFINVETKSVEELSDMLEAMRIAPKDFIKGKLELPVYRALYMDKMLEQNAELYASRDSNFRKLIKEFKTINESDFEVPESLKQIMRNYQEHGYKWLRTLAAYCFGGILADDMGLGKTLQSIALLLAAKEAGEAGTSLVICPASLIYNWQEEFARFAPGLKVMLIVGTQKERAEKIAQLRDYDVIITSYDLLKRDIPAYADLVFNYEFIDEAQFIKNHLTAAAKAVKLITAKHRFALTGTPIENRLSELWSIFDYLMPGYLYEYSYFKKEFEQPIVKSSDEFAAKRLKQLVSPFILRRLKQDVLKELPEKMEEVRIACFDAKQQALYDGQVVKTLKLVQSQSEEELSKSKIQILAELTRLRQICCDPSLAFSNYEGASAKRELCIEMVQSAIEGEHKVLIFSQFKSMLELLAEDLKREGIAYYTITGETPKEKRLELVRAFNNDATPVFLISLKAGGTGLNLTGADVVIHYDPWWNVAAQNQATDRAHRIGQKKVVSVYKLVAKNSIEEKIIKMQNDKQSLAESILSGEGHSSIFTMSKEELMDLL